MEQIYKSKHTNKLGYAPVNKNKTGIGIENAYIIKEGTKNNPIIRLK